MEESPLTDDPLHSFIERSGIHRAIRLYDGPIATEECTTAGGTKYELVNLPLFHAARCGEYYSI
ncbi:MAG: hypothetical protein ILP18_01705 [Treponema sp.]|nr:hypothetical protein [Treponema sp.]